MDEERHRSAGQPLVWLRPNGRCRHGAVGAQMENGARAAAMRNQCATSGHVSVQCTAIQRGVAAPLCVRASARAKRTTLLNRPQTHTAPPDDRKH